jgi:hypothetical protein
MARMGREVARRGPFGGRRGRTAGLGTGWRGSARRGRRAAGGHVAYAARLPGSGWLGKVELALANPRLARVHPVTDSNTPGPRSARFAGGRGSAEVATFSCAYASV